MPRTSKDEYNEYMREYRVKNRDKINDRRAQNKLWKQLIEDDERRARANVSLDLLLSDVDPVSATALYRVLARCTPLMVEELVTRAKLT